MGCGNLTHAMAQMLFTKNGEQKDALSRLERIAVCVTDNQSAVGFKTASDKLHFANSHCKNRSCSTKRQVGFIQAKKSETR